MTKLGKKELLTAEQLPSDHVMLLIKKPDGTELATVVSAKAGEHRVLQAFEHLTLELARV